MEKEPRAPRRLLVPIAVASVLWAASLGATLLGLWRYGHAAAPAPTVPTEWPRDAALPFTGKPQLVVFAHPKCACTKATLAELARLQADARVDTTVWFYIPDASATEFAAGTSWSMAARVPRSTVRVDPAGAEAKRFGVSASGSVLFYDARGVLRFAGGITPSRGHEGESPGKHDLALLIAGEPVARDASPIYGCSLTDAAP